MVIEFFIFLLCFYYISRAILRVVLPMLFQGLANKASQHNQQSYKSRSQADSRVKVDFAPKAKKSIPDSEGDFIDYEEIK